MARDEEARPRTVLELLEWAAGRLEQSGVPDARLNAELLLGQALGFERAELYARFGQEVTGAQRGRFGRLVRARSRRVPLQYLLGRAEFYGRQFVVGPGVMVPRQETELVVEQALQVCPRKAGWAADLCTGSGVIAVTLALERPGLQVVATDSSEEALAVAARNVSRHQVADRVHLAHGDLGEPVAGVLPEGRREVQMVVSNPPYVPTGRIAGLGPEVRDHEPRAALDGGPDGLQVLRRLIPQAAGLLAQQGWLVTELGEGQAPEVSRIVEQTEGFAAESFRTVSDPSGCPRVAVVRKQSQSGR